MAFLADPLRRSLLHILALCACKYAPTPDEPFFYGGLYEWRIDAGYCIDAPIREFQ